MDFLTEEFMTNADLVAYKGGDIERNLLNNMGVWYVLILRYLIVQNI
jgi:hypothetical protein